MDKAEDKDRFTLEGQTVPGCEVPELGSLNICHRSCQLAIPTRETISDKKTR